MEKRKVKLTKLYRPKGRGVHAELREKDNDLILCAPVEYVMDWLDLHNCEIEY